MMTQSRSDAVFEFAITVAIAVLAVAITVGVVVAVVAVTYWNYTSRAPTDAGVGTVILYNRYGEAETSPVHKIGSRCWVAWYKWIEKVLLRADGTAVNVSNVYWWTLDRAGPDDPAADRAWFAANCVDPPRVQ